MFDLEREMSRWRNRVKGKRGLLAETVEELESHLYDSFERNAASMPDEQAFRVALESLGELDALGHEFEKIDPLISIENNMKNLILGSFIAITGLLLGTFMMGGSPMIYFHPAELVALVLAPLGITVSSFGLRRFWGAARCVLGKRDFSGPTITVLKRWISATYATGGLVFLMGLGLSFMYLNDPAFGYRISASFSALIYSIAISELFLRSSLSKLLEQAELDGAEQCI